MDELSKIKLLLSPLLEEAPLQFNRQGEFSLFIRVWPRVPALHSAGHIRATDDELEDMGAKPEDLIRYRILVPEGTSESDLKVEIIQRLNSLGYRWLPFLKNLDRVRTRVFGFLD